MSDLKFKCFNCHQDSGFENTAEDRTTVRRMLPDANEMKEVTFLCTNCGYANVIEVSFEMGKKILSSLSSGDPRIQDAIERARGGDYSNAINDAKKKFGF